MKGNDLCIIIPDALEWRTKNKTKKKAVSITDNILHSHGSSFLSKHFQKHRPTVLTTLWSPSLRTNFNGAGLHFSCLEKRTWPKGCLRPTWWWTHFWLKSPSQSSRGRRDPRFPAPLPSLCLVEKPGPESSSFQASTGSGAPAVGLCFCCHFGRRKLRKTVLFRVCPFGVGENEFSFSCNFKHAKMLEA